MTHAEPSTDEIDRSPRENTAMIPTADAVIQVVQMHNGTPTTPALETSAASLLARRRRLLRDGLDGLVRQASAVDAAAAAMVACLRGGGHVLTAGNGGSAAEAQHLAAELVGRFLRERRPHAALCLASDTAVLTAIANDYGFDAVFSRQVHAHGRPGDVLVVLSTSGESANLVAAVDAAHEVGMTVVALTGGPGSRLADRADVALCAPAEQTPIVQELHTVVLHVLCDLVEAALLESDEAESARAESLPANADRAEPDRLVAAR